MENIDTLIRLLDPEEFRALDEAIHGDPDWSPTPEEADGIKIGWLKARNFYSKLAR